MAAAMQLNESESARESFRCPAGSCLTSNQTSIEKACCLILARARVAVEAGLEMGWQKYLGVKGQFVGMKSFGASAPAEVLYKHFGITMDAVVSMAKSLIGR
ncbi:MAG: hypothetical protein R3C03_21270 [Pirellulaceae bacterium]